MYKEVFFTSWTDNISVTTKHTPIFVENSDKLTRLASIFEKTPRYLMAHFLLRVPGEDPVTYAMKNKDSMLERIAQSLPDVPQGEQIVVMHNTFRGGIHCEGCRKHILDMFDFAPTYDTNVIDLALSMPRHTNDPIVQQIYTNLFKTVLPLKKYDAISALLSLNVDPNDFVEEIVATKIPRIIDECIEYGLNITPELYDKIHQSGNVVSAKKVHALIFD